MTTSAAVLPDICSAMAEAAEYRRYLDVAWTPARAVCVALLNQLEALGADRIEALVDQADADSRAVVARMTPVVEAAIAYWGCAPPAIGEAVRTYLAQGNQG